MSSHTSSQAQLGLSPCGTRTPQPEPIHIPPASRPRTLRHTGNREPRWARPACQGQPRTQGQARAASILLSLCGGERLRLLMPQRCHSPSVPKDMWKTISSLFCLLTTRALEGSGA